MCPRRFWPRYLHFIHYIWGFLLIVVLKISLRQYLLLVNNNKTKTKEGNCPKRCTVENVIFFTDPTPPRLFPRRFVTILFILPKKIHITIYVHMAIYKIQILQPGLIFNVSQNMFIEMHISVTISPGC